MAEVIDRCRFVVRLMSPLGLYPAKSFVAEDAALIVSPDLCFSIVKISKGNWASEVDCLGPSDLPLLGSFLLAGGPGTLYVYPYPKAMSTHVKAEQSPKITDSLIAECRLLDTMSKGVDNEYSSDTFHLPPMLGGRRYSFVEDQNIEQGQLHVLNRLRDADNVPFSGI